MSSPIVAVSLIVLHFGFLLAQVKQDVQGWSEFEKSIWSPVLSSAKNVSLRRVTRSAKDPVYYQSGFEVPLEVYGTMSTRIPAESVRHTRRFRFDQLDFFPSADLNKIKLLLYNNFSEVRNSFRNQTAKGRSQQVILNEFLKVKLETWTHKFRASEMLLLVSRDI